MGQENQNIKYFVRVASTDLVGGKPILLALRKVKGINFMLSNAICSSAGISKTKKAGILSDTEIKAIESVVKDPTSFGIPTWMLNRRNDYDTGEDKHLLTSDLDFTKEFDLRRLKKIKCNRGFRHAWGLPLRGQKTKSNFRKNKKKTALGVKRKKK
ncbi:MAG: 30S ribosomal protein S13 [Nanoarchaeota archaeon]|nr:30S ribosomal protein S13 [Nanoarchaeota archaeon]